MSDLDSLLAALGGQVCANYVRRERRAYWLYGDLARAPKSADAAIRAFSSLIDALPAAPRKLWDTAEPREFNIGVQAAMQPFCYEMLLSAEAVEAAAKLKARIVFTVYAPEVPKNVVGKERALVGGKRR